MRLRRFNLSPPPHVMLILFTMEMLILSQDRDTPLHLAAFSGNVKLCELLLNEGAEFDARNIYNESPLIIAFKHNREEVNFSFLKVLL